MAYSIATYEDGRWRTFVTVDTYDEATRIGNALHDIGHEVSVTVVPDSAPVAIRREVT